MLRIQLDGDSGPGLVRFSRVNNAQGLNSTHIQNQTVLNDSH